MIDATRQVRDPRRSRRAHAHGAALRRHVRLGHVRDRHPRRSVGWHDHDHRLRRAARRRARAGRSRGLARQGRRQLRDRLRVPQIVGGVDDDSLAAMDELVDDEGITSFKLFMAYPGVFLSDDAQILRAMQKAASNGSMIMMHAENGPAIDVLVAQALARARRRPALPRPDPPVADRGGGDPPRDHARRGRRVAPSTSCTCPPSRPSSRSSRRAIEAPNVFGETCPQYLYLIARGAPRRAGVRGREVGVLHAAALEARGPSGRPVAVPAHERPPGRLDRPLPVLLQGAEGARHRRLLEDPERHRHGRAPHGPALPGRGRRRDHARALGRASLPRHPPACSASTRARASSLPGADADIVVYDPPATPRIGVETHHMNMDHSAWEGYEIDGAGRHRARRAARSSSTTASTSGSHGPRPVS